MRRGVPVPSAQVRVDPVGQGPRSDIVRMVEADKDSRFSIDNLEPVTYKVFAMKETAAYPNTAFGFYSNHLFPTVSLTGTAPVVHVVLTVGQTLLPQPSVEALDAGVLRRVPD